jgi:hypothetical protein
MKLSFIFVNRRGGTPYASDLPGPKARQRTHIFRIGSKNLIYVFGWAAESHLRAVCDSKIVSFFSKLLIVRESNINFCVASRRRCLSLLRVSILVSSPRRINGAVRLAAPFAQYDGRALP